MLAFSKIFSKYEKLRQHPAVCVLIRSLHKESISVAWEKPEIGWTKLNFDGSYKKEESSIGGLIRNHKAEFLLGYAESIGRESGIAELSALRRGLESVMENGWSDVWVEGDAKTLLHVIANRKRVRCAEAQRHVSEINSIIPELNRCGMTRIYREGNRATQKFAQMGHRSEKLHIWEHIPPHPVLSIVHEDAEGKVHFRKTR